MKLGRGPKVPEYTIFLSSANDALELRRRVDGLIHNAVQPLLKRASADARFFLDMWEKTEPRRLEDEETVDDEFVQRAVDSNLVVTLLVDDLGSGTRKEIEAVLASNTEMMLLWFVDLDEHPDTRVGSFLTQLADAQVLRYHKAGKPDSRESWEAIVRVLLRTIFAALEPEEERYREER